MIQSIICILLMCSCFTNYIDFVVKNYNSSEHNSVSDVVSLNDDIIATTNTMTLLTLFTELEYIRNDMYRFVNIGSLLLGLNGLVRYKSETFEHNIFALITFVSIISQMLRSCNRRYTLTKNLLTSLNIYFYVLMALFKFWFGVTIFYIECLCIINFGLLYVIDFFGF